MDSKEFVRRAHKFAVPYAVTNGKKFALKDFDPADTAGLGDEDKPRAKEALQTSVETLAEMQDMLYAQDRWALLLIFQAMDAYEDAIRHTATEVAPWYVVPADNKWFTRVVVAAAIIDALASLGLHYPKVDDAKKRDLAAVRRSLQRAG